MWGGPTGAHLSLVLKQVAAVPFRAECLCRLRGVASIRCTDSLFCPPFISLSCMFSAHEEAPNSSFHRDVSTAVPRRLGRAGGWGATVVPLHTGTCVTAGLGRHTGSCSARTARAPWSRVIKVRAPGRVGGSGPLHGSQPSGVAHIATGPAASGGIDLRASICNWRVPISMHSGW